MRTFQFLILSLLIVFFGCEEEYSNHPYYQLIVEQSRYWPNNENGDEFGLRLRLTSNSDTLPPFYLMTCSWEDFAITNNETLPIGTGCDANFQTWTAIKSDEYLELITIVNTSNNDELNPKLRIGFIIIDTTEIPWQHFFTGQYEGFDEHLDSLKSQEHRLVWSNEVELKRENPNLELQGGKWVKKRKASNRR